MIPFGGGGGLTHDPFRAAWHSVRGPVLIALGIVAALVGTAAICRPGCSLPPPTPANVRRDAICAALHRGPDCAVKLKRLMAARIESDELNYSVYVGTEFVGQWPIANGEPIDPTLLTRELVEYHLQFQMGDPEFQTRLKAQFHCTRVGYVDRVMTWELGSTRIVIACVS